MPANRPAIVLNKALFCDGEIILHTSLRKQFFVGNQKEKKKSRRGPQNIDIAIVDFLQDAVGATSGHIGHCGS